MAQEVYGIFDRCCWFSFLIEKVEDKDNMITNETLNQQFGPLGAEPVEDVQEKSEQVHVALSGIDRK